MKLWRMVLASMVALVLTLPASLLAQQPPAPMVFSPGELEQLAAPIALYPDPLLAQVLMAATYPLEVVQAARFVRANPTLKDGRLNEALRAQDWDDSVKALAQFPQVLDMMDDQLDWTQRLGDAFLAQQGGLMDAVQSLRARAQAQGTLISSPQQIVRVQASVIYIEPASPQVIYVPVYNPFIVYGPWPYLAYEPYYYRPAGWPVGRGFYSFGGGIFVGVGLWGTCDWHRHVVFVDVPRYRRFTEVVNVEGRRDEIERGRIGPREGDRLAWQHDVRRRENVEYRRTAAQQHVIAPPPAAIPSREPILGRVEQPRAEQSRVEPPRIEPPRTAQPRMEQPRAEQPQTAQPRAVPPRAEQSRVEQPRTAQPRAGQPRVEQPRVEQLQTAQPRAVPSRAEQPRVDQPPTAQPRMGQPRASQPQVEQPQAEHPRLEQGRPQPGRGGQEAGRPSVQPAPRPESSRPNPGNSPRLTAHVQVSPAQAPAQRREPGERGQEKGASVATGSIHEASGPIGSSGGVQGGGSRR